jgi:cytidine deaminase
VTGPSPAELVAVARAAAAHAYAPYSRFAVGAALLLSDGTVVIGANLENASYGLSLCAETAALAAANSAGRLADVVAIAVAGGAMDSAGDAIVSPCGRCRQLLTEAAQLGDRDILVHCASMSGTAIETHPLSALLPLAFGPRNLG